MKKKKKIKNLVSFLRIERLQAIASWTRFKNRLPATQSTAANTDHVDVDPSSAAMDPSKSDEETISRRKSLDEPDVADRTASVTSHEDDVVERRPAKSSASAPEERRAEPFEDVVNGLAVTAFAAVAWLTNAVTYCGKLWNRAPKIYRAFGSAVHSERSRLVARWAVGVFEKSVRVAADVRAADGTTRVSFELFPATEHVVNISYG